MPIRFLCVAAAVGLVRSISPAPKWRANTGRKRQDGEGRWVAQISTTHVYTHKYVQRSARGTQNVQFGGGETGSSEEGTRDHVVKEGLKKSVA